MEKREFKPKNLINGAFPIVTKSDTAGATIAEGDMPAVQNMIWMLFSLFPAIIAGVMLLLVKLYPIKK